MATDTTPAPKRQVRPPTPYGAYLTAIWGARAIFEACGLSILGSEYVPRRGPAVLMGNHVSYFDPLLVIQLTRGRPVNYIAKEELFEVWNGWLFPRLNCIPVRRGSADMAVFRAAARTLAKGRLMGLFPEGTRTDGHLGRAQHGSLAIAIRAGVPIIPVGLAGTLEMLPREGGFRPEPAAVEAGPPLLLPAAWSARRLAPWQLDRVGARLMDEIARLRARCQARCDAARAAGRV